MSGKVTVVGDAMLDRYWDGSVERISPEAPVPVVHVQHEFCRAGGAANVALNLRALGSRTALITLLGDDSSGLWLTQALREGGVELHAAGGSRHRTTQKLRCVSRQQQLLRMDFEEPASDDGVNALMSLCRDHLPRHGLVVLSDYGKGCLRYCGELVELSRSRRSRVLVDPKGAEFDRYRGAWLLKPNQHEVRAVIGRWSDEADFQRRCEQLRRHLDLTYMLVTRAEDGMTLFGDRAVLQVSSEARHPCDVSGAGDTAIAALAHLLSRGMEIAEAVRAANHAAGLVVGKFGIATVSAAELATARCDDLDVPASASAARSLPVH